MPEEYYVHWLLLIAILGIGFGLIGAVTWYFETRATKRNSWVFRLIRRLEK
jgi:hypothetical protein